MQTSPRYQVSYPSADRSDAPDVATHLINIVAALERSGMYGQGPIASRPVSTVGTPGISGRFYASLDETPNRLYYDYGTGWFQIGALAAGAVGSAELAADAVTQVKMADNSVGSAEIIDGSVGSAEIADGSVAAGDLAAALKPSQGAGAAVEALRALGTAAGLAAAGSHSTQHGPNGVDPIKLSRARVARTATLSVASSGNVVVPMNVTSFDNDTMADGTGLVIHSAGKYRVTCELGWVPVSGIPDSQEFRLLVYKSGVFYDERNAYVSSGFKVTIEFNDVLDLAVGNTIQVHADQNTGVSRTLQDGFIVANQIQ